MKGWVMWVTPELCGMSTGNFGVGKINKSSELLPFLLCNK